MTQPKNGRLNELQLIARHGATIEYGDTGFVLPNRWISNAIIHDFIDRGLIKRSGDSGYRYGKGN